MGGTLEGEGAGILVPVNPVHASQAQRQQPVIPNSTGTCKEDYLPRSLESSLFAGDF